MLQYIGERIRSAREAREISQKKLGQLLGLSDKAISAYEAGRTYPPIDTLERIAKELEKPITYFLTDDLSKSAMVEHIDNLTTKLEQIGDTLKELKTLLKRK